jgi:hypothetical protein
MTYQMVGFWDALVCLFVCYMSNMVGGGKNLRINNIIMGRVCIKEESKWFSSCKMGVPM